MPNGPDENGIIIASVFRVIEEIHPMYVRPIEEPVEGLGAESKKWLEINEIKDAKWATVVDSFP